VKCPCKTIRVHYFRYSKQTNRNLDDGTHIIHPHRHALLDNHTSSNTFILAHKNFRVIAIGAPVPPYPGYPLDPPFRSRFQARHIDPINAMISLSKAHPSFHTPAAPLVVSLRRVIIATQYASEARADSAFHAIGGAALPPFPQTALSTLIALCAIFPPPEQLSPTQLTRLLRALHPALLHASAQAWTTLSEHTQGVGLGALGDPSADDDVHDGVGLLGYRATRVDRVDNTTAKVWFSIRNSASIAVLMRAGPHTLAPFPYTGADPSFHPSPRFDALLTSLLQAHALGMDLSLLPPVAPSASCSSTLLLRALQDTLGYSVRTLHIYKELGGRELLLRRHIKEGGATAWEPSTVVTGAWNGEVVHLSGLDAIGPTAGSLARLAQDREVELDEGRRIVKELFKNEVDTVTITRNTQGSLLLLIAGYIRTLYGSPFVPPRRNCFESHAPT
jgi:von Willebrand factor A domain-containing protein 8